MYLQRKRTRSLWRRKGEQLQAAVEKNATYLGRSGTSTLQQLAAGVGAIVVRRAGECNRGGSHPCQALSPRHSVLGSICRFLCPPEVSPASALRPVWGLLTVRRCPLTEEPSSEMVAKSRLSRFEVLIRSGAITLSLSRFCVYHTKRWPRHRLPQKDGLRQQGCGTVVFTAHNNTAGGSTERERGRNARRLSWGGAWC